MVVFPAKSAFIKVNLDLCAHAQLVDSAETKLKVVPKKKMPGLVCGGPFQSSATHMRIPSIGQNQQVTTLADKQSASASYWQVSCVVVLCLICLMVDSKALIRIIVWIQRGSEFEATRIRV